MCRNSSTWLCMMYSASISSSSEVPLLSRISIHHYHVLQTKFASYWLESISRGTSLLLSLLLSAPFLQSNTLALEKFISLAARYRQDGEDRSAFDKNSKAVTSYLSRVVRVYFLFVCLFGRLNMYRHDPRFCRASLSV